MASSTTELLRLEKIGGLRKGVVEVHMHYTYMNPDPKISTDKPFRRARTKMFGWPFYRMVE
jgi:hypothetical protein